MITQETYEELKKTRDSLFFDRSKKRLKAILYANPIRDIYDLLDSVIREIDGENEIKNVPDRIFLNIGEDTPDGCDFNELGEVTWSEERVSYKDIEYVRKEVNNE